MSVKRTDGTGPSPEERKGQQPRPDRVGALAGAAIPKQLPEWALKAQFHAQKRSVEKELRGHAAFHDGLSLEQAQVLLTDKPAGSFVIHEPDGVLTVSYKKGEIVAHVPFMPENLEQLAFFQPKSQGITPVLPDDLRPSLIKKTNFYPNMPQAFAEKQLKRPGDFLVRGDPNSVTLTYMDDSKMIQHVEYKKSHKELFCFKDGVGVQKWHPIINLKRAV